MEKEAIFFIFSSSMRGLKGVKKRSSEDWIDMEEEEEDEERMD